MKRQPKKWKALQEGLLQLRKQLWEAQLALDDAYELYRRHHGHREMAVLKMARQQRDHISLLLQKKREVLIRREVKFYSAR